MSSLLESLVVAAPFAAPGVYFWMHAHQPHILDPTKKIDESRAVISFTVAILAFVLTL